MRRLAPPLRVIESGLFDPSPELVRRWVNNDGSVHPDARAALDANPRARALADAWAGSDAEQADLTPEPLPEMPAHIAEQVAARVAVADLGLGIDPRPGLLLQIDAAIGPQGPLDWDLAQPLAVLLGERASHPDIWYGWLVAAESDYATHWDLLLEQADAPIDPSAAMVQVWNPVHVYCPGVRAALGQLSPERLAAVRDLAADLLMDHPDPAGADPGALVQRTTGGGRLVLTGTPLGGANDPRWRYQTLYFAAAGFVRDVARHALSVLVSAPSWWERVVDALKSAAERWDQVLEPVPVTALGASAPSSADAEEETHWRLARLVDITIVPSQDGMAVDLHVRLCATHPLHVALVDAFQVRQDQVLDASNPEADLFAGLGEGLTLRISDSDGNLRFEAPLPHAQDTQEGTERG